MINFTQITFYIFTFMTLSLYGSEVKNNFVATPSRLQNNHVSEFLPDDRHGNHVHGFRIIEKETDNIQTDAEDTSDNE